MYGWSCLMTYVKAKESCQQVWMEENNKIEKEFELWRGAGGRGGDSGLPGNITINFRQEGINTIPFKNIFAMQGVPGKGGKPGCGSGEKTDYTGKTGSLRMEEK